MRASALRAPSPLPLACLVLLWAEPLGAAHGPLGPEFNVSAVEASGVDASVAMSADGSFTAVWTRTTTPTEIRARRFQADGSGGDDIVVATATVNYRADVAPLPTGFVVVWANGAAVVDTPPVLARLYDASGLPAGAPFTVSDTGTYRGEASVVANASGGFVVVWERYADSRTKAYLRLYDGSGNPLGPEAPVMAGVTSGEGRPAAAWSSSGGFLVVLNTSLGVQGQRFDDSGAPLGAPLDIAGPGSYYPKPAPGADGGYIVTWHQPYTQIWAGRLAQDGSAVGAPILVNGTAVRKFQPSIASSSAGDFVVVWNAEDQDGSQIGVFGQRLLADGSLAGAEFPVNTTTAGSQTTGRNWSVIHPVAAHSAGNRFVVVWHNGPEVGSKASGQRFGDVSPAPNDFDADGRTDLAVYHAASGLWFLRGSASGSTTSIGFGGPGYVPVAADYDGDRRTDVAAYHPPSGLWFFRDHQTGTVTSQGWGGSAYEAVPGDYDGDGRTDVAVFHAGLGLWFIRPSSLNGAVQTVDFGGGGGYTPVPRDYDGDGQTDVAVYHAASGLWYVRRSSTGVATVTGFGGSDYRPVPGDYDGDAKADIAVYHTSLGIWFVKSSSTGTVTATDFGGGPGYTPAPGHFDGDALLDLAVYSESSGLWFWKLSTNGAVMSQGYGGPGYAAVVP